MTTTLVYIVDNKYLLRYLCCLHFYTSDSADEGTYNHTEFAVALNSGLHIVDFYLDSARSITVLQLNLQMTMLNMDNCSSYSQRVREV